MEVCQCDAFGRPTSQAIVMGMGDTLQISPNDGMVNIHIGYGCVPRNKLVAYIDDLINQGQAALTFDEFIYGVNGEGEVDDVELALQVLTRLRDRLTDIHGTVEVKGSE
ncbi:hypothetical protein [Methanoculleus sp.]|uniref:hypothetical protein n=1 Tax=Methanoculleus sp. TaxID=90427 RepID=UPI00261C0842|nr:hypothetical protein [Methanoculleus sp.]MDD2255474.1 hypothetical protein [Methanoculleus sp.]